MRTKTAKSGYWKKHLVLLDFMNRWFWKSCANPLAAFAAIPALALLLLYLTSRFAAPATVMPTVITLPVIIVPLGVLVPMVFDVRSVSFVDRLFVFAKKPIHANALVAGYGFALSLGSFVWTLFVVWLASFDHKNFSTGMFSTVDWGGFAFVAMLGILTMVGIATLIYTFIASRIWMYATTICVVMFLFLFSGAFFSMNVLGSTPGLKYISYLSLSRYIGASFVVAMNAGLSPTNVNGVHIFDLGSDFISTTVSVQGDNAALKPIVLFYSYDLALNIFVPLVLTASFLGLTLNVRLSRRR